MFLICIVIDLVTPNISACRKVDNTLLIKAVFIFEKLHKTGRKVAYDNRGIKKTKKIQVSLVSKHYNFLSESYPFLSFADFHLTL
jgi:hypothetical protein